MADQQPAAESAPAPARRLHLHIPNSHSRATSPRGSPLSGSPASKTLSNAPTTNPGAEEGVLRETVVSSYGSVQQDAAHQESQSSSRQKPWWRYFQVENTSGESSRDFLGEHFYCFVDKVNQATYLNLATARERTYFSWLRLATFLAIASVALFLRLRLRIFTSDDKSDSTTSYGIALAKTTTDRLTQRYAQAMVKKALRKRQLVKRADFNQDSTFSSPQLILSSLSNWSDDDNDNSEDGSLLRTNPYFSKVLGSFFFVLAVVALVVGHIDYMRCERALEEADKLVTPSHHDGDADDRLVGLHNAHSAKKAHSNM